MAGVTHDDGFHEIQLNGKQLVFLFMAVTVVSVVIFLCGVLVGRGVRLDRGAASPDAVEAMAEDLPAAPPPSETTGTSSQPMAAPDEKLGHRALVAVRRRVKRRAAIVLVSVLRVDVRTRREQRRDDLQVALPSRVVQRRRAVRLLSVYERSVAIEQRPEACQVSTLRGFDDLLAGIRTLRHCMGACSWT